MSHPIHHALEIRTTSEKPRRVRVPKIMYPNTEVDDKGRVMLDLQHRPASTEAPPRPPGAVI